MNRYKRRATKGKWLERRLQAGVDYGRLLPGPLLAQGEVPRAGLSRKVAVGE